MKRQSRAWEIAMAAAAIMLLAGIVAVAVYWWHEHSIQPVPHITGRIDNWYNRHTARWT